MFNAVYGTGVVASIPEGQAEGSLRIYVRSTHAYVGRDGQPHKAKMLFGLLLGSKLAETAIAMPLQVGDIVSFRGHLTGDSNGNPAVRTKDGKVWTAFEVSAHGLGWIARMSDEIKDKHADEVVVLLRGNLGRDVELRYMEDGRAVANMSVATNRQFTRGTEKIKETVWFRVSAWEKTAENAAQYLKKGSGVLVEGRLLYDEDTGGPGIFQRSDGTFGSSYEVSATTVRFESRSTEPVPASEKYDPVASDEGEEKEIPF